MAYGRRKTTRRKTTRAKRPYRSARTSGYAKRRSTSSYGRRRTAGVRRSSRGRGTVQTLRIVVQNTGEQPAARPNLQTALLGQAAQSGPKKAKLGSGG